MSASLNYYADITISWLMLNVRRLRDPQRGRRRGSFSAAADALSYTQSAVSQQIATLEAETGTRCSSATRAA